MIIGTGKIYMRASWCHSLKDKRMIVRSVVERVKNRFNVSISEVEDQDMLNYIVLGIATVSNTTKHAQSTLQNVLDYIENTCEAEVVDSYIEIV